MSQIWESRRVRVKNGAQFSCSGDRARKPTRKCVAVGHSEEQSRPHFDTSKSKITLLEMTPHPSLHSATKSYLQEDDFLLVAKPFCTQKGTPFLLALSFTILDHLPNQQKSQLFFFFYFSLLLLMNYFFPTADSFSLHSIIFLHHERCLSSSSPC